jgi:hypothetical protein
VTSGKDEQPDAGLDDTVRAARLSFRDYPSTSVVRIAALSSGLGWMVYKWLGRSRAGQGGVPNGACAATREIATRPLEVPTLMRGADPCPFVTCVTVVLASFMYITES